MALATSRYPPTRRPHCRLRVYRSRSSSAPSPAGKTSCLRSLRLTKRPPSAASPHPPSALLKSREVLSVREPAVADPYGRVAASLGHRNKRSALRIVEAVVHPDEPRALQVLGQPPE